MTDVSPLQHILFNPCLWIHPERFRIPEIFNSPCCKSVLNEILLRHYVLSTNCSAIGIGSVASAVVENWCRLPHVAYLLACRYQYGALKYQGEFSRLPKHVQEFSRLPMDDVQPIRLGSPATVEVLEMQGLQLLSQLAPQLPAALSQRIPLLFSHHNPVRSPAYSVNKISSLDFKLAIQYAKHHYDL